MGQKVTVTTAVARVLAALVADPAADRYGLELMGATGLPSGTLYPILTRLERAGWLTSAWEQIDTAEAGRPARRYYRLSDDGLAAARHELAQIHQFVSPATQPHGKPRIV
jgi:DNA-binding PadR family transcriptional regulator